MNSYIANQRVKQAVRMLAREPFTTAMVSKATSLTTEIVKRHLLRMVRTGDVIVELQAYSPKRYNIYRAASTPSTEQFRRSANEMLSHTTEQLAWIEKAYG